MLVAARSAWQSLPKDGVSKDPKSIFRNINNTLDKRNYLGLQASESPEVTSGVWDTLLVVDCSMSGVRGCEWG